MEKFEIESIRKELEKMPNFLTISQVSKLLNVNYFTVYRQVVIGEIDGTKIGGIWRIPKSALVEYLEERHPFNRDYI